MSNVRIAAINKAEAFLRAAGCQYRIVDSEGNEIANTIAKVRRARTSYHSYKDHYTKYLRKFDEGDMDTYEVTVQVPDEYDFRKYKDAFFVYLISHYGKENVVFTSHRDTRTIELILIRQPKGV